MASPFLGVEDSFTGRLWAARAYDERQALAMAQRYGLPDIIARSLSARGLDVETAPAFLEPRLRELMPDPSLLKDMDKAVSRFVLALERGEKIAVFGDYDVDGATSSALLVRFARALGRELRLYIPDRITEGYGPNDKAMHTLAEEGVRLVLCVDCGTTAHGPLKAAKEAGLDVIVIDHHAAEFTLPPCVALINPNRMDETMTDKLGALAAVGVTYLFVVAVNRALREARFYAPYSTKTSAVSPSPSRGGVGEGGERPRDNFANSSPTASPPPLIPTREGEENLGTTQNFPSGYSRQVSSPPEPDLRLWLDLVALGTVCDVVKLTGLNRAYVAQGLKVMTARRNVGIAALAKAAGASEVMDTYTAGFILGPRVNAGGRVGTSDIGARLLSSEDESEVVGLAEKLNQLNAERRAIEADVLAQAETMLFDDEAPLTFVANEQWHPGVIGIVASRLKDKFHRPAIVIGLDDGVGKGSGRSVGAVDLGEIVIAARQAGLLINGGGHKMAAGLTVARDNLDDLHAFLAERIGKVLAAEPFVPTLTVDGLVAVPALDPSFIEKLSALAPFGTGNPEPRFALSDCKIVRADIVGERHVKVIAAQGTARLDGIAFRAMESGLGPSLLAHVGQFCHLAGHLRHDTWQGRNRVQLLIDDAAKVA
ncbi:MAG: single-stranded-DNA-specific exonuclease RecJ [Alphaproteobacteria bacterium]|nr:single-stranded-DNA-specific exonuclease RecJ [Alphaproteobacteria bacterium]